MSGGESGSGPAASPVPKGWAEVSLEELGVWTGGGTPSKGNNAFWDGSIPWASPKDMKTLKLEDTTDHITEEAVEGSAAKRFAANSLAFVVRSGILEHTLPISLVKISATANQDLKVLTPSSEVNPEWLLYALLGKAETIRRSCRKDGTTVASIDFPKLQDFPIFVPPRAEQARIVAAVESAMAAVDEAEADLRQALSKADTLAAAGIDAVLRRESSQLPGAVSGEPHREGRRLSEVADIRYGYTAKSHSEPRGVPFLRITDIQNDSVDWDSVPYCEISDVDHDKFRLQSGDLVFARSGATTGKSFLVEHPPDDAVFASYLIRVRPKKQLRSKYLALLFRGADYWRYVGEQSRGMAQPNLNGSVLGRMEVLIPPLGAQDSAVAAADTVLAEVRLAKTSIEAQLKQTDALRRSILYQSFTGCLVPQDPDDEPAAELLERIKSEKAGRKAELKAADRRARKAKAANRANSSSKVG